jgi:uncharacterized membrane protein YraQ (UPF0718 family)
MQENKHLSCHIKQKHWYQENLFLIFCFMFFIYVTNLILVSLEINILKKLIDSFFAYLNLIWLSIIAGLILGGVIDHFVPKEYISKFLAGKDKKSIIYAAGLGLLMSGCSHGILAISMELYKKGASVPAIITFLLASPWANMTVTILLIGLFSTKALYIISSSVIIAIITGFIYQFLDSKNLIERNKYTTEINEDFSIRENLSLRLENYSFSFHNILNDIKKVFLASWELAKMVLWWILLGMFLASIISAYVPHDFFMKYLGPTLLGLFITLAFAAAIEICSEGSAPLSFEIFKQTGAFGNAFVFLNAGVATDYTEIGLIWSNIGKRAALWLPIIAVPQVLLLGYLFNRFIK